MGDYGPVKVPRRYSILFIYLFLNTHSPFSQQMDGPLFTFFFRTAKKKRPRSNQKVQPTLIQTVEEIPMLRYFPTPFFHSFSIFISFPFIYFIILSLTFLSLHLCYFGVVFQVIPAPHITS